MQEIQPLMQELQRKYGNDQQRFALEYQKLLKEKDMNKAIKVSEKMECGGFVINGASFFRSFEQPFGGWKYSGIGNEGIMTTLREMSRTKTVILKNVTK